MLEIHLGSRLMISVADEPVVPIMRASDGIFVDPIAKLLCGPLSLGLVAKIYQISLQTALMRGCGQRCQSCHEMLVGDL
jgi:hypothetical protein